MVYKNIISDAGFDDMRPYEKCLSCGAEALADSELLAAIIRSGTTGVSAIELSKRLLEDCGGLNGLYGMSVNDFMDVKGIGKAKAVQLCCILELSKRIARQKARERLDFSDAATIAHYYMEDMRHLDKEYLMLVMLDVKCCLIKDMVLTIGTSTASMISSREIFTAALNNHASSIILIHNHPSGNPTPSTQDVQVTGNVVQAGKIIGIELLDHIIIGDNSYCSFRQMNFF